MLVEWNYVHSKNNLKPKTMYKLNKFDGIDKPKPCAALSQLHG